MISRVLIRIISAALLFFSSTFAADDFVDLVRKGNQAYFDNNFDEALEYYHNAQTELPESAELDYNIAGSLFKQGKYEEAVDLFTKALNSTDINLEASSHYNLGNTYFRMQDFQNAIKSYENSLNINPDDLDAKYNLELARKRLKEQIKPEQQDQDQQQQDQKEQQQKQDQQQDQEQDKQDQDQQQQQDKQEPEGEDEKQKEKQQQQPEEVKEMTKEDAERILNALKDEQDVQKKIRRQNAKGNYSGKDW